jgi:hypothetical protein
MEINSLRKYLNENKTAKLLIEKDKIWNFCHYAKLDNSSNYHLFLVFPDDLKDLMEEFKERVEIVEEIK